MLKKNIVFTFIVAFTGFTIAQDYSHVKYGSLARQYLDIYIAPSARPTPVYIDAHYNGGTTAMPNSTLNSLKSNGISIVSWESLTSVANSTDIQTGWDDAELMFSWVKANAATYNFDTTNFIIGGASRGTILSWKFGQRTNPNIKGLYMYNALPSVWNDPIWWWPPNDVTVSSPPIFFVYLREPGCSTTTINPDIHDPNNGYKIMDKYTSLGIGDRDTLVHSLNKTNNTDRYQFLLNFALKVIKPLPNSIYPIVGDNTNLKVFPNPFSKQLIFNLYGNEQTTLVLYDFLSRKILQQPVANSTTINTQQLENGLYFYLIMNSTRVIAKGKVIKN